MAAHEEARTVGNAEIAPAHLVLGLLSEPEALAAQAIVVQGVTLDAVRDAATSTLPASADAVPDLIPYNAEARTALELTFGHALELGHNYIGTEHILLALLKQEAGTGPLTTLGIDKTTAIEFSSSRRWFDPVLEVGAAMSFAVVSGLYPHT